MSILPHPSDRGAVRLPVRDSADLLSREAVSLGERFVRTANHLASLGLQRDDCVAYLLPNLPEAHYCISVLLRALPFCGLQPRGRHRRANFRTVRVGGRHALGRPTSPAASRLPCAARGTRGLAQTRSAALHSNSREP